MLGIKDSIEISDENVIFWNYISGTQIDAEKAGRLLMKLAIKYGLNDEDSENLYNGVTEAITNTVMHAYGDMKSVSNRKKEDKWWMFTGIKDGDLNAVVCDVPSCQATGISCFRC